MTEIRHIFFDIGGVLGSNGWDREQRQRAVERFALNAEDFQWRHEEVIGEWEEGRMTLDEYLDIAVFHTERNFSRAEFIDFMHSQSVPNDDAIAIARLLSRQAGYTLMTLNNESEELNAYRIEKFGISPIFEAFLSSCWLGVRKPIRRFYHRALGIAHAEPASSLFIDDRQQNLTPATTLGMNVVLFESAAQLRSDLERLLDLELSGA
ncbi:MAG TPA: HAD-IA family hydrolase [Gemmatimonadaceae bacterium]|nr:HAD-IA family hydrolase [Gemmatimonadaceae bacterium]